MVLLRGVAAIDGSVKDLTQLIFNHEVVQGTGADFFFSDRPHASLSPALTRTLEGYEFLHGQADQVFDLTQTPATRPRTLLTDGSLPVLTRGCKFFAQRCSRFLSGPEELIAQGWALHHSMRVSRILSLASSPISQIGVSLASQGMACIALALVLFFIGS